MSANETLVQPVDPDNNEAFFWCEIPIPNYLMAIAVGHLEYRSLGRNVGIFTVSSFSFLPVAVPYKLRRAIFFLGFDTSAKCRSLVMAFLA